MTKKTLTAKFTLMLIAVLIFVFAGVFCASVFSDGVGVGVNELNVADAAGFTLNSEDGTQITGSNIPAYEFTINAGGSDWVKGEGSNNVFKNPVTTLNGQSGYGWSYSNNQGADSSTSWGVASYLNVKLPTYANKTVTGVFVTTTVYYYCSASGGIITEDPTATVHVGYSPGNSQKNYSDNSSWSEKKSSKTVGYSESIDVTNQSYFTIGFWACLYRGKGTWAFGTWTKYNVGAIITSIKVIVFTDGLKGEGTSESPYSLENKTDFAQVSQAVANGKSFDGEYFKVNSSEIDFSGGAETVNQDMRTARIITGSNYGMDEEKAYNMFDKNNSTKFYEPNSGTFTIVIDFGQSISVSRFYIVNASDAKNFARRQPKEFRIEASSDNNIYSTIYDTTDLGLSDDNGATKSFNITTPGSYRYFKITAKSKGEKNKNPYDIQLAEFGFSGETSFNIIGNSAQAFSGNVDGNNSTIKNLIVSGGDYSGLFGYMNGGSISNLTIDSTCSISGGNNVGAFVGYISGGTVLSNLTNNASATGTSQVGGIFGNACFDSSTGCSLSGKLTNSGSITGTGSFIGGIGGIYFSSDIADNTEFVNNGSVTAGDSSNSVGGIFGFVNNKVGEKGSYKNTGAIKGGSRVGGIIGRSQSPLQNCINEGSVEATSTVNTWDEMNNSSGSFVGGITSSIAKDCPISHSYNKGTIKGSNNYVGGIVGYANGSSLEYCANEGAITGADYVGGVAGYTTSSADYCYHANGTITSTGSNKRGVANSTNSILSWSVGSYSGTNEKHIEGAASVKPLYYSSSSATSATATTSWADIVSTNFNGVRTSKTSDTNKYIKLTSDSLDGGTYTAPTSLSGSDSYTVTADYNFSDSSKRVSIYYVLKDFGIDLNYKGVYTGSSLSVNMPANSLISPYYTSETIYQGGSAPVHVGDNGQCTVKVKVGSICFGESSVIKAIVTPKTLSVEFLDKDLNIITYANDSGSGALNKKFNYTYIGSSQGIKYVKLTGFVNDETPDSLANKNITSSNLTLTWDNSNSRYIVSDTIDTRLIGNIGVVDDNYYYSVTAQKAGDYKIGSGTDGNTVSVKWDIHPISISCSYISKEYEYDTEDHTIELQTVAKGGIVSTDTDLTNVRLDKSATSDGAVITISGLASNETISVKLSQKKAAAVESYFITPQYNPASCTTSAFTNYLISNSGSYNLTITKRILMVSKPVWTDALHEGVLDRSSDSFAFTYNGASQGLVSSFPTIEHSLSESEYTLSGEKSAVNHATTVSSSGNTVYTFTVSLNDESNYSLSYITTDGNVVDNQTSVTYKYVIKPKDISNGSSGITFGYFGDVSNNGLPNPSVGGYRLNASYDANPGSGQVKYVDTPAIIYYDTSVDTKYLTDNFAIFNGNNRLSNSTDIIVSALPELQGDEGILKPTNQSTPSVAITGQNNYVGTYSVWFTLMKSDFDVLPGHTRDANWGTSSNPYVISQPEHMLRLSAIVNATSSAWDSVKGVNEITNATATKLVFGEIEYSDYSGCYFLVNSDINLSKSMGFKPVGTIDHQFKAAEFKGNTNAITINITYEDSAKNYIAVFGYVYYVNFENITVSGTVKGQDNVGGLVGQSNAISLINCTNLAKVSGRNYVGGLVGQCNSSNIISGCVNGVSSTSVTITATGNFVGGICGQAGYDHYDGVTATNYMNVSGVSQVGGCFGKLFYAENTGILNNYGNINATSDYAGGVIGLFEINGSSYTVNGALNEGSVTGTQYVGGIVGISQVYYGNSSYILNVSNANNKGPVNGTQYVGGIIGNTATAVAYTGTVTNKGRITGTGSYLGGIAGKSTNSNISGATLRNMAVIRGSATSDYVGGLFGYLTLSAAATSGNFESYGTNVGHSYVGGIAGYVNTNSKALTGKFISGYEYDSTNYLLAGIADSEIVAFCGLYGAGIFGYAEGNSTVKFTSGTDVSGQIDAWESHKIYSDINQYTGSVLGGIAGANINLVLDLTALNDSFVRWLYVIGRSKQNVTIGSLPLTDAVCEGTICGFNSGTIKLPDVQIISDNSIFATVDGNYVGGIVGYNTGSINNVNIAISVGDSTNKSNYVGGIAGFNFATGVVTNIKNVTKPVYGINYVGGFFGWNEAEVTSTSTIDHTASVTGTGTTGYVGGFAGYSSACITLKNFTQSGNVTSSGSYVGGLFGYTEDAVLDNVSYANTAISGVSYVGGIAGYLRLQNVASNPNSITTNAIVTATGSFVGGYAGFMTVDREGVFTSFTPVLKNGTSLTIQGKSYVGAIFGYFVGGGYKANQSTALNTDTAIHISSANINVKVSTTSDAGDVIGGLFGYIARAGIIFDTNWKVSYAFNATDTAVSLSVNDNYFGGIVGILGENAAIEWNASSSTSTNTIIENNAAISSSGSFIGGIAGYVSPYAGAYDQSGIYKIGNFINLKNSAAVEGASYVGGFFGAVGDSKEETITTTTSEEIKNTAYLTHRFSELVSPVQSETCPSGYSEDNVCYTVTFSTNADGENVATFHKYYYKSVNEYTASNFSSYTQPSVTDALYKSLGDNNYTTFTYPVTVGTGQYITTTTVTPTGNTEFEKLDAYKNATSVTNAQFENQMSTNEKFGLRISGDTNYFVFEPKTAVNLKSVSASGSYAGGFVGYAGTHARLSLVNEQIAESSTDTNIVSKLKIYNSLTDTNTAITAASYAGGFVGYLGKENHTFTNLINKARVGLTTSKYVGGLVGYADTGVFTGCVSIETVAGMNMYLGTDYVGGLIGYLDNGTVASCFTKGFAYFVSSAPNTTFSKGGVIGYAGSASVIRNSWTFYTANGITYQSNSPNTYGKYVLIESGENIQTLPSDCELCVMSGLLKDTALNTATASGTDTRVKAAKDYVSFSLNVSQVPTNNQIAFYETKGSDIIYTPFKEGTYDNTLFETNSILYVRLDAQSDSIIVDTVPVVFRNIPLSSGAKTITQNTTGDEDVDKFIGSYNRPSSYDGYRLNSFEAVYGSDKYISTYKGVVAINLGGTDYPIGSFNEEAEQGSEATPYLISDAATWKALANKNTYSGKIVRVTADFPISASDLTSNLFGSSATPFSGTFDGDGHTITITDTFTFTSTANSVFPSARGTIKNLTIAASNTMKGAGLTNIAVFVGQPSGNLTIENCTNKASIENAYSDVGGFVGHSGSNNNVSLITCVNQGHIYSTQYDSTNDKSDMTFGTGGVIGNISNSTRMTLDSCKNEGEVRAPQDVGGIVGISQSTIDIQNCANTGNITSFTNGSEASAANEGFYRTFSNAGGIVGKTSGSGYIRMYASYNSGTVTAYGSIAGGLIGSVGDFTIGAEIGNSDRTSTTSKSYISYCYNTGLVQTGGTYGKYARDVLLDTTNCSGSIVGGIAGLLGPSHVSYCYNAGRIISWGTAVYGARQYHYRMGGIVGQACAQSATLNTHVEYCYNVGHVEGRSPGWNGVFRGDVTWQNNYLYYGAGIIGYIPDPFSSGSSSANYTSENNCYSVSKSLYRISTSSGWMDVGPAYNELANQNHRRIPGTICSLDDLTAYMKAGSLEMKSSDGSVPFNNSGAESLACSDTDSTYLNGTKPGWIYVYGCLPQLAVFAVDTKEGLSMRSKTYGQDIYGAWHQYTAGAELSPYVVKDGIDLLGVQALTNAGYSFSDKYISYANTDNNISKTASKYINLADNTSNEYSRGGGSDYLLNSATPKNYTYENQSGTTARGKSYQLYAYGAVCCDAPEAGQGTAYGVWKNKNTKYNGSSWVTGVAITDVNFYPIGNTESKYFAGSFDGIQTDNSKTIVRNAKIYNATIAGLFGYIQDATVSNITLDGEVKAMETTATMKAIAGMVAIASGSSKIDGLMAGSAVNNLSITTILSFESYTSYTGGIVGEILSGRFTGSTWAVDSGLSLKVQNCVSNAAVTTAKSIAGGIVGYAAIAVSGSANTGNQISLIDNNVKAGTITATAKSTFDADAGTAIGGIVGTTDGKVNLSIQGCTTGNSSNTTVTTPNVTISGENKVGGIIGYAPAGVIIGIASANANAVYGDTLITRANLWGTVLNNGEYGTSIGGFVGYGVPSSGGLAAVIFAGSNEFYGHVLVSVPTDNNGYVEAVGGLAGYLGTGAAFREGCDITISGIIEIADSVTLQRSIGGVTGIANGAAFSGKFTVSAGILAEKSSSVGGFIGTSKGQTEILTGKETTDTGADITIATNISAVSEVGGFVGEIVSGSTLNIGSDAYSGVAYNGSLTITVTNGALIFASGKADEANVGGIVGLNNGSMSIIKGTINNQGTVTGGSSGSLKNNVGGVIGKNAGNIAFDRPQITNSGSVSGGDNVGGTIGYLATGTIAGTFTNSGAVSGVKYVGGSVGRADSTTVFTTPTHIEGATVTPTGSSLFTNSGTVSGKTYVGGSVGVLFGEIKGYSGYNVGFINSNIVSTGSASDARFIGGSFGIIAGKADYASFDNAGRIETKGQTSIGGSIGLIGFPEGDDFTGISHRDIEITNCHFEFTSSSGLNVGPDTYNSANEGGVGGIIGAIYYASLFNETNSFFVLGSVHAPNLPNVGGSIGIIHGGNAITVNGLLAYKTIVEGYQNVGGIIGAVLENGSVSISNSYNVSIDGTGDVVASVSSGKVYGGIVGLAPSTTDAHTSYWVKGFPNEQLASLNINNVRSVGHYNVEIVTERFEGHYSPAGDVYLTYNSEVPYFTIGDVYVEASGVTEDNYFYYYIKNGDNYEEAGNESSEFNSETVYYEKTTGYTPATGVDSTNYRNYFVDTYMLTSQFTSNSIEYYLAATGQESLSSSVTSWEEYMNQKYAAKVANQTIYLDGNRNWVEMTQKGDPYSTGIRSTGYYFLYASDTGITAGHTESSAGSYAGGTYSKQGVNDIDFWKRIANSYTTEEINSGKNTMVIRSEIAPELLPSGATGTSVTDVRPGGQVSQQRLYAKASSNYGSGFFLYMKSSTNSGIEPYHETINNSTDFFITVNLTQQPENVVLFYRTVGMGSSLVYNGNERFAPITLNSDEIGYIENVTAAQDTTRVSKYYYTVRAGVATGDQISAYKGKDVGTYVSDIVLYYYDAAGRPYEVGSIKNGVWDITPRQLNITAKQKGVAVYNGTATTGDVEVAIDNYCVSDGGNATILITFESKEGSAKTDKFVFTYQLGTTNNPNGGGASSATYITNKGSVTLSTKSMSGNSETGYNLDSTAENKTYSAVFNFTFTNALKYTITVDTFKGNVNYENLEIDYVANPTTADVEVQARTLHVGDTASDTSGNNITPAQEKWNGSVFSNDIYITGWANSDSSATAREKWFIDFYPYWTDENGNVTYFKLSTSGGSSSDPTKSLHTSGNASYVQVQGSNKGTYEFGFNSSKSSSGTPGESTGYIFTEDGNYKIQLSPNPQSVLTISENGIEIEWSSSDITYNGKTNTITATLTAKYPLENENTWDTLLSAGTVYLFDIKSNVSGNVDKNPCDGYKKVNVSTTKCTITFTTNKNADTYIAKITGPDSNNINHNCPVTTHETGSENSRKYWTHTVKINKKALTVSFTSTGTSPYIYNTYHQGVTNVSITGFVGSEGIDNTGAYGTGTAVQISKTSPSERTQLSTSQSGNNYTVSGAIDAGTYTVSASISASYSNYSISSASSTWTIDPYEITLGTGGTTTSVYNGRIQSIEAVYDDPNVKKSASSSEYKYNTDIVEITFLYANGEASSEKICNVGKYDITISSTNAVKATRSGKDISYNYTVKNSAAYKATHEITPVTFTVTFSAPSSFVYLNSNQGPVIASNSLKTSVTAASNYASASFAGLYSGETITVNVSGSGMFNAGSYTASTNGFTITGNNEAGATSAANYVLTSASKSYEIIKSIIKVEIAAASLAKVYDGTTVAKVPADAITLSSTNSGAALPITALADNSGTQNPESGYIYGTYDTKNVGTGKTVTFSVANTSTANYIFDNGTNVYTGLQIKTGSITRKLVTITMNLSRNKATKVYDGNNEYAVFTNGNANGRSVKYKSGQGFTVAGTIAGDDLVITAVFKEADTSRSYFDAFINNVTREGSEGSYTYIKTTETYKNLMFTVSSASNDDYMNYSVVINGFSAAKEITSNTGDGNVIYLYDSSDKDASHKNADTSSVIGIEITAKTITASYANTTQSYANDDNSFNHMWKAVTGTSSGIISGDGVTFAMINGWMYDDGTDRNPNTQGVDITQADIDAGIVKEYTRYTTVRGTSSSKSLRATLVSTNGKHLNYILRQQPTLTIGYFVNQDGYEINSFAGLMLATYYYSTNFMETSLGDDDINTAALINTWNLIKNSNGSTCTWEDYEGNANIPTDLGTCTTWDEYFDKFIANYNKDKEEELKIEEISYEDGSASGAAAGWGYWVNVKEARTSYLKFKQTKNISAVLSANDLAIINGQFGSNWGFGTEYLSNFIKCGAGETCVAINAVFPVITVASRYYGFLGEYNGNGFTIDNLTIMANYTPSFTYGTGSIYAAPQYGEVTGGIGMFALVNSSPFPSCSTVSGTQTGYVTAINIRNAVITVADSNIRSESSVLSVGGLIGVSQMTRTLTNSSFHGTIVVRTNGAAVNAGGLIGLYSQPSSDISEIVKGSIISGAVHVYGNTAVNAGALIGNLKGSSANAVIKDIVSVSEIIVTESSDTSSSVGALVGNASNVASSFGTSSVDNTIAYLVNSVLKVVGENETLINKAVGSGASDSLGLTYDALRSGSKTAYNGSNIFDPITMTGGTYDVMDKTVVVGTNDLISTRLNDIIDIYVLLFALGKGTRSDGTSSIEVTTMTQSSPLVGKSKGTSSSKLSVNNQQQAALLREIPFAVFELKSNVKMYSTHKADLYNGYFHGTITGSYTIDLIYATSSENAGKMFRWDSGTAIPCIHSATQTE